MPFQLIDIVHYTVNQSLTTGKFPDQLKLATIRPDLKKPGLDADDLSNYRLISNLKYLSKIIEKFVHKKLTDYLTENKLLAEFQSGYQRNYSCETAIVKIVNDVLVMVDKRNNVIMLLLDLSAAFDTLNHDLLVSKLKRMYGVNGVFLQWIKSYLQGRRFKVAARNDQSSS